MNVADIAFWKVNNKATFSVDFMVDFKHFVFFG